MLLCQYCWDFYILKFSNIYCEFSLFLIFHNLMYFSVFIAVLQMYCVTCPEPFHGKGRIQIEQTNKFLMEPY